MREGVKGQGAEMGDGGPCRRGVILTEDSEDVLVLPLHFTTVTDAPLAGTFRGCP